MCFRTIIEHVEILSDCARTNVFDYVVFWVKYCALPYVRELRYSGNTPPVALSRIICDMFRWLAPESIFVCHTTLFDVPPSAPQTRKTISTPAGKRQRETWRMIVFETLGSAWVRGSSEQVPLCTIVSGTIYTSCRMANKCCWFIEISVMFLSLKHEFCLRHALGISAAFTVAIFLRPRPFRACAELQAGAILPRRSSPCIWYHIDRYEW